MSEQEHGIRFTDGAAYEQFMGLWSRKVGAVFLDWFAMPAGQRWLDVGCGTGMFTEMIAEGAGPSAVVGVDPAPAQIEHARSKHSARGAAFRIGDAQALPFGAGEFDVVTSALVFNFIPDLPKGVNEMKRVARPGGWVGGYVWDIAGDFFPLRHLAPIRALNPDIPRTPGIEQSRIESLRQTFEGAGLTEVVVRPIDVERTYASFDEYWRIFLGNPTPQSNYANGLPSAERDSLRQTVRAGMPVASDGTVTFMSRANAVKGRVPG
jgi:ubiquinone/menaquinone biosynthesis C-methylase UbiE